MYAFFNEIFKGKPSNHYIYLWTLKDHRTHWFKDPEEMAEKAETLNEDVYFGLGSSPYKTSSTQRLSANTVEGISCLHVDIDFAKEKSVKKYAPTSKEAKFIAESIIMPSCLVFSGHGIHAYYFFDHYITNKEELKQVATLLRQFQIATEKLSEYTIDMTHDLSRVLRVPCSKNYKDPRNPIQSTIINENYDVRYSIAEIQKQIEKITPTLPAQQANFFQDEIIITPSKEIPVSESTKGINILYDKSMTDKEKYRIINQRLILTPGRKIDSEKMMDLIDINGTRFYEVFNHEARTVDNTASTYDMSLANMAADAGFDEQTIADLLIQHREKHKEDMKLPPNHDHYYGMTIYKAWLYSEKKRQLSAPTGQQPTDSAKEMARDELEKIIGIQIENVIKYEIDPEPDFWIKLKDLSKLIHLGTFIKGIMNRSVFIAKIQGALAGKTYTGTIKIPDKKEWNTAINCINRLITISDTVVDATFIEQMKAHIRQYIMSVIVYTNKKEMIECDDKYPILLENDYYYISDQGLYEFLKKNNVKEHPFDVMIKMSQLQNIHKKRIPTKYNKDLVLWKIHITEI